MSTDNTTLYQVFDAKCLEEKEKLDAAGKARESMEKASNTENEVAALAARWEAAKKVAEERVEKVRDERKVLRVRVLR